MTTGARRAVSEEAEARLLAAAREAAQHAHGPYSGIRVGAALLVGGEIYVGCNVENASSGLTVCAERVAIGAAVAAGHTTWDALALAFAERPVDESVRDGPMDEAEVRWPCGACLQVLAEFCPADFPLLIEGAGVVRLGSLLPHPFRR